MFQRGRSRSRSRDESDTQPTRDALSVMDEYAAMGFEAPPQASCLSNNTERQKPRRQPSAMYPEGRP